MGNPKAPNLAGRQLVRELRRMREKCKLGQAEAGRELHYDVKKMSRIENGQIPEIHGFKAMLDLYGLTINEWAPYLELWEKAQEKGWWYAHGFNNRSFPAIEHDACLQRNFQNSHVPGLLQTEDYARAVFTSGRVQHSREWVENRVAVRLKRAQRLYGESPLKLHVLLDEYVLRRKVEPTVMRGQLELILERSELPNVTVQVVPDRGLYQGNEGYFLVLSYPDPAEPDLAYVGVAREDSPEQVRQCSLDFEHIAKLALSPDDTRAFIEGLVP